MTDKELIQAYWGTHTSIDRLKAQRVKLQLELDRTEDAIQDAAADALRFNKMLVKRNVSDDEIIALRPASCRMEV